ncbi:hypothetical protein [Actinomadura harenae]|uniref:Superinfection immunity protein n=1 Tax=Actinomadura harenae TaxID=2483351 RepID=A0A3M2LN33_9ACTN|nr:hypothetical protein [Actinomadura harenae]RMI37495.1 hypothetical protein EBO15_35620 [Actinomadura harenae]
MQFPTGNAGLSLAFLIIVGVVMLPLLPTWIAVIRGAEAISFVLLINIFCCATVLGWPIALVLAFKMPRRSEFQMPPPP